LGGDGLFLPMRQKKNPHSACCGMLGPKLAAKKKKSFYREETAASRDPFTFVLPETSEF
jgi:hypothetical protein